MKRSKTLQRHLDGGIYEAKRSGNILLAADFAFLSLMKEGTMTHAGIVLRKLLKDWEIYQLRIRIERDSAKEAMRHTADNTAGADTALETIYGALEEISATVVHKASDGEGNNIIDNVVPGMIVFTGPDAATDEPMVNSGHFLLWILASRELISGRVLEMYGVTADKAAEVLAALPSNEDFLHNLALLDRLSRANIAKAREQEDVEASIENNDEQEDDYMDSQVNVKTKNKKKNKSLIEQFGVNLTAAARKGGVDPVVGREKEIERLIQILGRRKKNNPILVGEAGVGKSAIVEGLALRIAAGEAPRTLSGKDIFSLDMASLVAGTKYRGEFEERLKGLIDELRDNDNVIVFIDEIHTIAGAGSTQGSLDTANILKPALARGELQCVGATTLDEYRENIESDSALERRFQKIIVEPTTAEQTLVILHNIKGHYEKHHAVRYTDEALRACVELTGRYVTDRNFPDKAIDAMDEAGSKARLFNVQEPAMLRELDKALAQAEEQQAEAAVAADYSRAAEARVKVMALKDKVSESRGEWQRELMLNPFILGAEHIEEVITSMTGIPVEKVSQGERMKLAGMQDFLSSRVIGQDTAVEKVTKSIQRSRTGLKDPDKPIGVFMFVGPTGVGKTHLAKEVSRLMFDREDALVRIDMSEYSEKHNVSRMIGSPPGYVGYNEGGQLTETVRRQPYSVVLFDEIEKAHPDVFNIMLQIFDEGQLTDGLGRRVDFRNTIIIMTSNAGSRRVAQKGNAVGYLTRNTGSIEQVNKETDYRQSLESIFAPEFINRIDDIVIFNTLSIEDVQKIVELELAGLKARAQALGYRLKITPKAKRMLAEIGYEPRYGVRSLKRTILEMVEEPLAQLIVNGQIGPGNTIRIESRDGTLSVQRQPERLRQSG